MHGIVFNNKKKLYALMFKKKKNQKEECSQLKKENCLLPDSFYETFFNNEQCVHLHNDDI